MAPPPAFSTLAARLQAGPGDPFGARAARLSGLLAPCFGRLGALPEVTPPAPQGAPPLRAAHAARAALTEAAREVVDGFLAAELDRVAPHLAEHVTVLGPDRRLVVAPAAALLNALEAAEPQAAAAIPSDYRSYQPAELRAVLPRGHASLLAAAVPHRPGAVAVTAQLDARGGGAGRVVVFAAPELVDGRWRVASLPLPSPDDVVVAGARLSAGEDLAVRVADRVGRAWWLGQAPLLTAQRNDLMRVVMLGPEALAPETLPERAAALPAEGASWAVFGAPREAPRPEGVPAEELRELERSAPTRWRARWADLAPRWFEVPVGRWDMDARSAAPHAAMWLLLLRQEDRDVREETRRVWRVGGIWGAPVD